MIIIFFVLLMQNIISKNKDIKIIKYFFIELYIIKEHPMQFILPFFISIIIFQS